MILAIDTAANLCAACIHDADRELGRAVRDIGKGHAEQLMDVIGEAMGSAGLTYADLDAIAVAVGPGSFTGIRVGVATARGLALALKIPAIGVTTLEALAYQARELNRPVSVTAAIDAGRDGLYVALYDDLGNGVHAPQIAGIDEAMRLAMEGEMICGSAARRIADAAGVAERVVAPLTATADIGTYARLAAIKPRDGAKPKPLYLRAPDAKPQAHAILARKP
ncbi:MAG TPA: tRNA (adenosine(37)-N6)-threonylcarbamoyltransferase complex dimerization subunit type 1 TsaB [Rhizobiaceae bacterium]|nr:tRNA (adenosine(37)-N6)-threonylcarbamoyltransferase complex dimerization subunit type 1 TsaB [Rhizobiaceae bacterium]